jgi:hypothetical protein
MTKIGEGTGLGDSQLEAVLDSILTDITAIRTVVNAHASTLNAATVAGTGYTSVAALTTTT